MEGRQQLRLLLWRDYLIRKRKFITLAGILWAIGIMIGAYSVRINIDNMDFPTCQFAARALPSAGVLPFLQSFICSVNNECSPLDQFEEVPSYEKSKLTQIQSKLSPLFNSSVLEMAGSMPDAVKLLATVAGAADEPTFIDFSKNGLKLMDLFMNPSRVKRYVTSRIQLDDDVAQSLMTSEISFQGILNGNLNLCNADSISQTLKVQNKGHLQMITTRLCEMPKQDLQKMFMEMLYEVNFSKYIKMLGTMYAKISGDSRLAYLGDFVTAVLRMTKLQNFLPPEAMAIFYGKKTDFSYLKLDLIPKFVELFAPTFGDTSQYQSIKDLADTAVVSVQYMSKIFSNVANDTGDLDADGTNTNAGRIDVVHLNKMMENVESVNLKDETIDPFNILAKLASMIVRFLPKDKKHEVLFYSTLLSKLMESAHNVIETNMHIEQNIYNATLRNTEAMELLKGLDPVFVSKGFDALVSAERTQILTSNINTPSQLFCDVNKVQKFLLVSPAQAELVKKQLCSDTWKVFVDDLFNTFGVREVRDNINEMASLLIQETLGKDTSSQMYSIDKDLGILRRFTSVLITMDAETRPVFEWRKVLGLGDEIMKVVNEKAHLGKLMLISVNGAIAKEIVKQNTILQYKISPILININTFVAALNEQLAATPAHVSKGLKEMYGDIVYTVLKTATNENKTVKSMSTYSEDILCYGGQKASNYMQFPNGADIGRLTEVLCNASRAIENGLKNDSIVSKAIVKIMKATHTSLSEVNWTELINNIQNLYVSLDRDYPYLFEFSTYSMNKTTQNDMQDMCKNAKDYWFAINNLQRGLHLSVNLGFRLLDLLDHGIFNFTSNPWLKIKFTATKVVGYLAVMDDTVKLATALLTNSTYEDIRLPPITVSAMNVIIPNLPQLIMDTVFIVIHDDTDIEPIITLMNASPPWPCSTASLSELLTVTSSSKDAIKSFETVLCMDRGLQDEWSKYFNETGLKINSKQTFNTTQYEPHLFLKTSAVYNAIVDDIALVKDAVQHLLDEEKADQFGLLKAWRTAVDFANSTQGVEMIGKFFTKFDMVLETVDTAPINTSVSLNTLWEGYIACISGSNASCLHEGRAVYKSGLRILSVVLEDMATDMTTYFAEANAPDHNVLQVLGFTKSTALYSLYNRLPEFIGVLVNSYWDYGFMSQIRRATQTQFWDCDSVVSALVPAPGSSIQEDDIKRVKPYLCPSLIYWLSLPRDDNVLFNTVAKPQYYFYSFHVKDANSSFARTFQKGVALAELITEISKENKTSVKDTFSQDNLRTKLTNFIDSIINYRLNKTDDAFKLFSEVNKNQFISHVYLTRLVAIVNKLATSVTNLNIDENFIAKENIKQEDVTKVNADLSSIKNIFKRKAVDVIAMHYDLLTDLLWKNDDNYTIIDAMDNMCSDLNSNTSKVILLDEGRVKAQICAKSYKVVYRAVQNTVVGDFEATRQSLLNLIKVLQSGDESEIVDLFDFLNGRTQLVKSLKQSISYSYDVGLPIYLKQLQFNLQGYKVILSFLAGEDWWSELRRFYEGPEASKFFEYMEQGFEIADNFLNNLDGIHLVRLIREISLKESSSICKADIILSDYIPDSTGALSAFKQQLCAADKVNLFKELPPLLVAAQGYDSSLRMSKDIGYDDLNKDISYIESNVNLISNGPKDPLRPTWITQDRLDLFRNNVINLLSKETLTKMVFGILSNAVDAGTLYLDNSQCTLCSQMTTWFKQLNLQLYKKQEYNNLLCHLHTMSLDDIYYTLKNDFHWDMFVIELLSSRNYTTLELNKSLTEFLGLAEVHLLDDMRAPTPRLAECLAGNVTGNAFGNASLIFQLLAHTAKLLRAGTPHLHKVDGFKDFPYFKQLYFLVAHRLDIYRPLKEYLRAGADLQGLRRAVADDEVVMDLMEADVNLREAKNRSEDIADLIRLKTNRWEYICGDYDCGDIYAVINSSLNWDQAANDLSTLQTSDYWQFSFISSILEHIEGIFSHTARLSGVASGLDFKGAMEGRLAAMLDLLANILMDETVDSILYSMEGLLWELHPLLQKSTLEGDLEALYTGLRTLHQFKTYLVDEADLRLQVSTYFPKAEAVEEGLGALGINNTNFWSLAAPRIHAGHLQLKPVLTSKERSFHISKYACEIDAMSEVLSPAGLDVVSAEEVSAATVEQFCALTEDIVKETAMVLFRNADYTTVIDKVKDHILSKLYAASDLTEAQGSELLRRFPRMAASLPTLQASLADVMHDLKDEPLFEDLKDFSSVGNLLTSSDFLAHAGSMMCGAPFHSATPRLIGNVIKSKDQAAGASQAQLDVLPTEFCRSMYLDIISMQGGKIVWSFVKPLLMGKILYTPPTPAVHEIIHKANASFATMIQMTSLVHSFSTAFPALGAVSAHRAGVSALQQLVSSPGMEALRRQILGDVQLNVDVEGVLSDFGDLESIGKLVSKASELLRCFNLDRFAAAPDETALTHEAARLTMLNEFSAGLVFMNEDNLEKDFSNVEYKIRMDIENVPTTARMHSVFWIPGPEDSFIENMRYFRGFIQVQDMVDKAIIQLAADKDRGKDLEVSRRKREVEGTAELDWAVYTQQEPYPCYRKDYFQTSLYESQALLVVFTFALLLTVASATRFIVHDKESGNTMLMSVMGVNLNYHTLSWFLTSYCEMALTMGGITLVLKCGAVLPRTDASLLLAMLLVFGASILSFCYMMSKLFWSASFAAVCVAVAFLLTFMPFVIILSLEAVIGYASKLMVCLSMSSAFTYGLFHLTRLEATGRGAAWRGLFDAMTDADVSLAGVFAMLAFDALLYLAVGCLIDRYNGIKSVRSSISRSAGEKAGVSIRGVCMTYARGRRARPALHDVSIELHSGQVTTLLGHNGAGKTTLTNILTGMVRPSAGRVVLRGAGAGVGACPQHDVLVACLTAREHVALYASLAAGLRGDALREEVDRMLEVLSLGAIADEQVSRLSGGTRRRVCVALAFVARPALVSLDEPTAGVDPNARREIWDMIVKLKEDRTILLTTHHLDEAEILSDQIVIMHKGQVHTKGSPIEIKRSLGSGYKLTIRMEPAEWGEEEHAKNVLATVRGIVPNATIVDASTPLEVALPFYDAHGANNDFLQLCSTLEAQQTTLCVAGFTLDCSSLEDVFCDIVRQADSVTEEPYTMSEAPSKRSIPSASSSTDSETLVPSGGPRRGTRAQQLLALLKARYLHVIRNRWLVFMLLVLPTLFLCAAMAFSCLRPPPDNERALPLSAQLYPRSTQYAVSSPSIYSEDMDPAFARQVMSFLQEDKMTKMWTEQDSPKCKCSPESLQVCEGNATAGPEMMILPDVSTLNHWLTDSLEMYMEKRYGGFTSTLKNNKTNLVVWYNNKGHHAMPAFLSAVNNAILRAAAGTGRSITTYSHPLKISKEQLSKDTIYQHVADAGVTALVLVALSAAAAGGAVPLVAARTSHQKTLQRLAAVSPALYWAAALIQDLTIMFINMLLTSALMLAFGFPVFVERNNLPAICILIMLFGYACCSLVHVFEKLFQSPSLANMLLFCGNAFLGLAGLAVLLILDVVSESDATDHARWVLHKIFLLSPQFALGDGILEIAKNTIQAQVLYRYGMDTYKDPLYSDLIGFHVCALVLVGTALLLLNLTIEYGCFDAALNRFSSVAHVETGAADEAADVAAERQRVAASLADTRDRPLSLPTLGNINRGFVHTEGKKNSLQRSVVTARDAAQCVGLSKAYPTRGLVLRDLTLGIAPGQCMALLGENGAGKSTTFSLLTGAERPTRGHVYLDGKARDARGLARGLISYCPQSDAIDPLLTVRETLQLYCRLRGITDEDHVVARAVEMFDLAKYRDVRSGALSGGNKRKLCTAIAFMGRTPLVLLDEPTSGMDPVSRGCVWRGCAAAEGARRAVLLSTHALDDARRAASRVALLRAGRLIACQSLASCLDRFGGGYVVQCTGADAARAWHAVTSRARAARLRLLHARALHFHVPTRTTVDGKDMVTPLSSIFRVMSALQAAGLVDDYTVAQSSLEQMFLDYSAKSRGEDKIDIRSIEPVPTPHRTHDVTSL